MATEYEIQNKPCSSSHCVQEITRFHCSPEHKAILSSIHSMVVNKRYELAKDILTVFSGDNIELLLSPVKMRGYNIEFFSNIISIGLLGGLKYKFNLPENLNQTLAKLCKEHLSQEGPNSYLETILRILTSLPDSYSRRRLIFPRMSSFEMRLDIFWIKIAQHTPVCGHISIQNTFKIAQRWAFLFFTENPCLPEPLVDIKTTVPDTDNPIFHST